MEGHFGSSGIYDHLREVALKYAFLLHALSACPDDGSGGGEPLRDNAFIAAVTLGIVILLGGVKLAPNQSFLPCDFICRHGREVGKIVSTGAASSAYSWDRTCDGQVDIM